MTSIRQPVLTGPERALQRLWDYIARRALVLGLALAMLAIAVIGIGGIAASVVVAERIQGSGSAINIAGSLRMRSHRMGSQALADALERATSHEALLHAIEQFEATLAAPALTATMARQPDSDYAATYRIVRRDWSEQLKPMLLQQTLPGAAAPDPGRYNLLLARIDAFVADINTMVAQLEADTEAKIQQMRTLLVVVLALFIIMLLVSYHVVRRKVLAPLAGLLEQARHIAGGDFSVRIRRPARDELGQLGRAFNTMAAELSRLYADLERRVAEKTAELSRSNQSLQLLYNAISRLHKAPLSPQVYAETLEEIEQVLGLTASQACLVTQHGGMASILASSMSVCQARTQRDCEHCIATLGDADTLQYRRLGPHEHLLLPLRDSEGLYGVLRLALPPGRRLEDWQEQLVEALSRHIGIALGISHQMEQDRLLALQEERSVIARELHDSIAQSLSYMKIQASLLQSALADPERRAEAQTILRDLRQGITAAYRQLRELLTTFRLKMEGDFVELIRRAVDEFTGRGGASFELEVQLDGCRLTPNQEIHSLHIVREALYNVLRHAQAHRVWVRVLHDEGWVRVSVEDDGIGLQIDPDASWGAGKPHYGLSIMRERAESLHGRLTIENRPQGGTRIDLSFPVMADAGEGVEQAHGPTLPGVHAQTS